MNRNPFEQFREWLEEAQHHSKLRYPNAVALATVDAQQCPSVRMVLLKGMDEQGFQFFTNYESKKAKDLAHNPQASLCFFWDALGRQIRISGSVAKLSSKASDEYFASRPYKSKLGAWASKQSKIIPSREALEQELHRLEKKYSNDVPRPDQWGGYLLSPTSFEFWIEQENRLHDRFQYLLSANGEWIQNRLSP